MNQRRIPFPKRPLPGGLPAPGSSMMVRVMAPAERFTLLARATRTTGDTLCVPTGRPLPMGTWVDVLFPDHQGGQEIQIRAMVSRSRQRQGLYGMELVLLPLSPPANA